MHQYILKSLNWYRGTPTALKIYIWIVVLPTVLAAIYYGIIASDIYISEARFAVRTSNHPSITNSLLDSVLSGTGTESAGEDTAIVRDFILSHDMLDELDRRLDIRKHFESSDIDYFSRLDDDASEEDFLDYYRNMVQVSVESYSNIATIQAKSFDPVLSQKMANVIMELSEDLVNKLSDRIAEDTVRFAKKEVDYSEDRIRKASDALTAFRSETQSINPDEETGAVLGIVTKLETQLAESRAHLIEARDFMREDSPQVKVLKGKVQALEKQVQDERLRLASKGTTNDYTQLIDKYQPLILEQELSKQRYTTTLTSLEIAQAEAQRKQRYLLPFIQPKIPDEALLPERFNSTLIVFVALSLIYAIGGLIWAAVKDHMRI